MAASSPRASAATAITAMARGEVAPDNSSMANVVKITAHEP